MINKLFRISALAVGITVLSAHAFADTATVKAAAAKFEPTVIFLKEGDAVQWSGMAAHDTAAIAGMIPDGAEAWRSKLGEDFSVTLKTPGAYVYKCTPHVSLGMVGAIVVGEGMPVNLEKIKNNPENKGIIGRAVQQLEEELQAKGAK